MTSKTLDDEQDIHDRVRTHSCTGFLGFYSTIPSSGLAAKLNIPGQPYEVQIYDPERIEKQLLASAAGLQLAKRFFPISLSLWLKENKGPAKIFDEDPSVSCFYCKRSLLSPEPHGIVVVWTAAREDREAHKEHTQHFYWCCKGDCDRALQQQFRRKGLRNGWEDIPDLTIPVVYIRWVMSMLNEFHRGMTYSPEALENMKELLLNLFPLVARDLSEKEKERTKRLLDLPSFLGGLG